MNARKNMLGSHAHVAGGFASKVQTRRQHREPACGGRAIIGCQRKAIEDTLLSPARPQEATAQGNRLELNARTEQGAGINEPLA